MVCNISYIDEEKYDNETEMGEIKYIIMHPVEIFNTMNTFEKIMCFVPDFVIAGFLVYTYFYKF